MKITKKDFEKGTVLSLTGKIRIGSGDVELREAIDRAVAEGPLQQVCPPDRLRRIRRGLR